jgi:hypothetical protein
MISDDDYDFFLGDFFSLFVLRSSCGVWEFLGLGRREID